MASKKCLQCAESVKADAKVCRFCGHAFPEKPSPPVKFKPKPGGCATLVGFFVVLSAATFLIALVKGAGSSTPTPAPTATASVTPEDPNAITPTAVGWSLKSAARDPDTLVVERALQNDKRTFVCVAYRAKNGFGGMNRERAVFTKMGGDTSARTWNRKCTVGDLTDVTAMVSAGTHFGD